MSMDGRYASLLILATALYAVGGVRMRRYNYTAEAFLSEASTEEPSALLEADESTQVSYQMIGSGTCKNGYVAITSSAKCKAAAKSLGLASTTVHESNNAANPTGCYYRKQSSTKKLWFNTNSAKKPATSDRRLLCSKKSTATVRRRRTVTARRRRTVTARRRRRRRTATSVVQRHGKLRVKGNKIVDKTGTPVRLRGMSMFWSQWSGKYWNANVVKWLKKDFRITLVRAAMGVEEGGYLDDSSAEKAKLTAIVDACIAAGIYVVIDWHDHHAEQHLAQAKKFFDEMARKYGSYPNVLFEVYNEPKQQDWSGTIKPYHEAIVPVIRRHTDNIIVLGTRFWSQEVDTASSNPVAGKNLAYTIHFYSQIHKQELRNKVSTALNNGVAIFATEWGTGFETLDLGETQRWLDFLEQHQISDANWGIYDKAGEQCALLKPGASGNGGWSESQLTESGRFVRASLRASAGSSGSARRRRGSSGGGGGDCGDDGSGWCHQSSSNCATCSGSFDASAPAPTCR
jgi:endoglucanase